MLKKIFVLSQERELFTFSSFNRCFRLPFQNAATRNMAISSTVMAYPSHLHHRLHPRCILVNANKHINIVCKSMYMYVLIVYMCIYTYIYIHIYIYIYDLHTYVCLCGICLFLPSCMSRCVFVCLVMNMVYRYPSYACTKFAVFV